MEVEVFFGSQKTGFEEWSRKDSKKQKKKKKEERKKQRGGRKMGVEEE